MESSEGSPHSKSAVYSKSLGISILPYIGLGFALAFILVIFLSFQGTGRDEDTDWADGLSISGHKERVWLDEYLSVIDRGRFRVEPELCKLAQLSDEISVENGTAIFTWKADDRTEFYHMDRKATFSYDVNTYRVIDAESSSGVSWTVCGPEYWAEQAGADQPTAAVNSKSE